MRGFDAGPSSDISFPGLLEIDTVLFFAYRESRLRRVYLISVVICSGGDIEVPAIGTRFLCVSNVGSRGFGLKARFP